MSLSIIITNFNYENYLPECIESVLNQTFEPCEIIIADDASTDNSKNIINSYEEKYPIVKGIFNSLNLGLSKNKHNAILQAKGLYIKTIDSDDYLCNKFVLENEMNLIQKYQRLHNKEIIAFSKRKFVEDNGKIIQFNGKKICEGYVLKGLLTRNNFEPGEQMMSKKQYLSVGGYEPESKLFVDYCLRLKLASQYEYYCTGNFGTAIRLHGKGMSSANNKEHFKWQIFSFIKLMPYLKGIFKVYATIWFIKLLLRKLLKQSKLIVSIYDKLIKR